MKNKILQKCVEELKKDTPKIDYVLGMLESVIELSEVYVNPFSSTTSGQASGTPGVSTINNVTTIPEEEGSGLLGAYERGPIASLKS